MNQPTSTPILNRPGADDREDEKKGRAADSYKKAFWKALRAKSVSHEVYDALQVGTDNEGGYLVPDEFDRHLIDALNEENIFRKLAHVIQTASGDRKMLKGVRLAPSLSGANLHRKYGAPSAVRHISVLPATERSDGTAVPIRKKASSTATERRYRKRF